jgi:hypothetical protein
MLLSDADYPPSEWEFGQDRLWWALERQRHEFVDDQLEDCGVARWLVVRFVRSSDRCGIQAVHAEMLFKQTSASIDSTSATFVSCSYLSGLGIRHVAQYPI